ncbi:acyl-CoA carboxylase subunit epsilon [Gulosibacter molinativorax]|uniref:Acyl-CoA carboxylase subunit epsilon n=1 Tax=Gulosibacter molinativorax TaxID=256821 RepID=A0ABT7C7W4_9MICO|nr:acyl-CoA carboxylase subunit epsilon [Gulosibacter molinativorax]MDJ1371331.1 acyl-CoA carboxylase subunit epsilon [Gulosibacter molinativorax]QUY63605.1 Hypotetical protein [Gulosibacter molinativorax]
MATEFDPDLVGGDAAGGFEAAGRGDAAGNGAPGLLAPRTGQPRVSIPDLDVSDSLTPGDAALVRGNPTDEEIGAVAATLAALFEGGVSADRPRDRAPKLSPWARSQRYMQGGMMPGDPLFGRYR